MEPSVDPPHTCKDEHVASSESKLVSHKDEVDNHIEIKKTEKSSNLSKNQLKKIRRFEQKMEVKKRRKEQDKAIKLAKAKAAGRNLEEERRLELERRLAGESKAIKEKFWVEKRLVLAKNNSFQVCIDCSFDAGMTGKEINSLALQIRYCYSVNKRNQHPCLLTATSVSGLTRQHLENVAGFDEWHNRAFTCTSDSLDVYYKNDIKNVVYLTSDSENTLKDLDNTKTYVIGGIVDRNRLKKAAWSRAKELNLETARLPIDEHLLKMDSTRVLTCNHVFEILLKYRINGNDWGKALLEVLPSRKEAKSLTSDCITPQEVPLSATVTCTEESTKSS